MERARRDAVAKAAGLAAQNTLLHNQLEDAVQAASAFGNSTGGGGESGEGASSEQQSMHEVVRYLRQEKEAAMCQLEVLSLERSRWQRQAESARHEADQTRATLAAAQAAGGAAAGGSAADGATRHAALMAKVEHLNVVQESNSTLRAELEAARTQLSEAKRVAAAAAAAADVARREAAVAKVTAEGAAGERELLQADAARWEQRTQQLLDKYGQVDLAEHNRVKGALDSAEAAAREQASQLAAAAEAASAEAASVRAALTQRADKSASQHAIALKHITKYNPEKMSLPDWEEANKKMKARLVVLEAKAVEWQATAKKTGLEGTTAAAAAAAPAAAGAAVGTGGGGGAMDVYGDGGGAVAAVAAPPAGWEKEKAELEVGSKPCS
jgi:nucleoprotein TPR